MAIKLAVSGWRGMKDDGTFEESMGDFIVQFGSVPSLIITGGSSGADTYAMRWAKKYNVPLLTLRPQYDKYHFMQAPLLRNTDIVAAATHLLAFPSYSHGRGTQDTISKALSMMEIENVMIIDLDARMK